MMFSDLQSLPFDQLPSNCRRISRASRASGREAPIPRSRRSTRQQILEFLGRVNAHDPQLVLSELWLFHALKDHFTPATLCVAPSDPKFVAFTHRPFLSPDQHARFWTHHRPTDSGLVSLYNRNVSPTRFLYHHQNVSLSLSIHKSLASSAVSLSLSLNRLPVFSAVFILWRLKGPSRLSPGFSFFTLGSLACTCLSYCLSLLLAPCRVRRGKWEKWSRHHGRARATVAGGSTHGFQGGVEPPWCVVHWARWTYEVWYVTSPRSQA